MNKIALCQMSVLEDKARNEQKACEMLVEAAHQGAWLAILPEMFNCPYELHCFADYAQTAQESSALRKLAQAARQLGIWVVGGSIPELENGKVYNTSFTFSPDGQIVAKHRKAHLFDVDLPTLSFRESDAITPGQELCIVPKAPVPLGVAVCYDIRFPEWTRMLALSGAKLLALPAAFGQETGRLHWELLLRARAVDNQIFIAGVSPAPVSGMAYQPYGHSMLIDPWGRILAQAGQEETLLVCPLDMDALAQARSNLPVLKHRRPELYQNLNPENDRTNHL